MKHIFAGLLFLSVAVYDAHCFVEGLYCGVQSCYDVLGVTREATKRDLARAYRKLARNYHPDVYKGEDKEEAEKKFRLIATAYEVLKDDESRKDYDYMLDNPEEAYYHYWRFYKRRLTPKVDVRIVLAVTITVISILQYLHKAHRYEDAIVYAMQNPKFRNQAMQIIHQEGLLETTTKGKSKNKKNKEDRKREEERVLREVVEESIDIRGGYSKPNYQDVLWVQLLYFPYYSALYMTWAARWVFKFWIMKEEFGDEEKEYLTYKGLNFNKQYWDALDDFTKEAFINKQLWVAEKLKAYRQEQEEEARVKLAESGRHKMWRRYLKKGGPGQMTFMED